MTWLTKILECYLLCQYLNNYADPLVSRYRMVLQFVLNQPSFFPALFVAYKCQEKNVKGGLRRIKSNPMHHWPNFLCLREGEVTEGKS